MSASNNFSYVVAIASGKGGVGKSVTAVNCAVALHKAGYKTAIIDADLGLSNCATLLNQQISATALDLLKENAYLEDIIQETDAGITLVTGADEPNAHSTNWSSLYPVIDEALRTLNRTHDFILIDTPAGASDLSLWALDRSDLCMLLLVDEPTVISDVYRFCKFVLEIDPSYPFGGIVNFGKDDVTSRNTLHRFNKILTHFMNRDVPYFGYIPAHDAVKKSVKNQKPISEHSNREVLKEIQHIAGAICEFANKKSATTQQEISPNPIQ